MVDRKEGKVEVTAAAVSEQVRGNGERAQLVSEGLVKKVSIMSDETILATPIVINSDVEIINSVEEVMVRDKKNEGLE